MQIEATPTSFDYPTYFRNQPQRSIYDEHWFSDRDPSSL